MPSQRGSRRDALPESYLAINAVATLFVSLVLPDDWSVTRSLLVGVPAALVIGIGLCLLVHRRVRTREARLVTRQEQ